MLIDPLWRWDNHDLVTKRMNCSIGELALSNEIDHGLLVIYNFSDDYFRNDYILNVVDLLGGYYHGECVA